MLLPQLTVIWDNGPSVVLRTGIELANLFGLKRLTGASVTSRCKAVLARLPRAVTAALVAAALMVPATVPSATEAQSGVRKLKLYYVHTKEKAEITFKRNGRYDQKGLQQLNRFLRDWRRNEPTKMDPRLFDLVWEVYQKSGATGYINVVSAYRSPATNSLLRSRSRGVAKKSQHMLGKAMDFYIPGVKLASLRSIGMKFQVGGVGYYPRSGSPFVHMDVGSVRAWPRMSRKELVSLFPDGKTMHLPSDGKPLPGYNAAVADYKRRVGANSVLVAGGGSPDTAGKKRKGNFLAALFGGGGDEDEEPDAINSAEPLEEQKPVVREERPVAVAAAETKTVETEVAFNAPVPLVRPAFKEKQVPATTELALVQPTTSTAAQALEAALPEPEEQKNETVDLASLKIPVPELLTDRGQIGETPAELMTASAGPVEDAEDLGIVPVPDSRPELAQALLAAAEADVAVPETADRVALAANANAEQSDGISAEAAAKVALAASTVRDRFADDRPVEMAALVSESAVSSRSLASLNAFDAGDASDAVKGGRPQKKDADAVARGAIRTKPKLTQKIISQWALTKGRVESLSKPVKAPRFVSREMRAAPTTVYMVGFESNGDNLIDPERFSGTAVNFMEVRKFAQAN